MIVEVVVGITKGTQTVVLRAVEGRTSDERAAWGRAIRQRVKRGELARPQGTRDRDPVDLMLADEEGLVAELLPIRHARMARSAFAFLRGSAGLMAYDLAGGPSSGIPVQLCGDAHVSNFGFFATPERNLIFDVNDFDETHAGPFEWDVLRLATSAAVAARDRAHGPEVERAAARTAARAYREAIAELATMRFIDVWFSQVTAQRLFGELEKRLHGKARKRLETSKRSLAKAAAKRTSLGSLEKLAEQTDDGWRIREAPPLVVRHPRTKEIDGQLRALFESYAGSLQRDRHVLLDHYRLTDFARKVVGVGSVGTDAFVFLLIGSRESDPLFLQLKEARPSVLAAYVDADAVVSTEPITHQGERVVTGQRLMQAASDAFLGWASGGKGNSKHFYFRQLRDMKVSAEVELMNPRRLVAYTELCARTLARAHARSGSSAAIAAYLGGSETFDAAAEAWGLEYADQNDRDYAALTGAIADGRLEVAADER
jgi:uncharacterized protein (DUF2252 family)